MSDRLYVATRKGLFRVDRNPAGWSVEQVDFVGDSVLIVHPDRRNGWVYAALGHGHFGVKLHRSKDGGSTWEPCAAPEYPTPPEGTDDRCPSRNIPIPWRTEQIWSLASGGPSQEGRLWCGTVPGGLFRSDDHGDSWALVRSLWDNPARAAWFGGGLDYPGIHSICVDPSDADRVHVGISCGGVWQTLDGGETWACRADGMVAEYMPPDSARDPNIQDPHALVQCRADPNSMWVQHHNGVFRTTNGAERWEEITAVEPSKFGFAVAVHPEDAETAWFVPAVKDECRVPVGGQVVVSRTRDGGASFEVLRNGLPQSNAFDLTFRHALDIDETGNRLAFGSTTGSLWASENQGDGWSHISAHLPPVYCVRFA